MSKNSILIGEIQKNALEKIKVTLQDYKEHRFIDIRVYYENNGIFYPSKKGICLNKDNYKETLKLIEKAGKELGGSQE